MTLFFVYSKMSKALSKSSSSSNPIEWSHLTTLLLST
jgi:hypothetical protein